MDTIASRIREARKAAGLTQLQVAEHFGIERVNVTQWEGGTTRPDQDRIAPLAKLLGVSVQWLLEGSGVPPKSKETAAKATRKPGRAVAPNDQRAATVDVPEADVRAGLGGGGVQTEAFVATTDGVTVDVDALIGFWGIPEAYLRGHLKVRGSGAVVFEVYGDSMYDPNNPGAPGSLYPGDKVIADTGDIRPSPPGPFVVWDGTGLVVKLVEVVRGSDPPRIRLSSRNPGYSDYEATVDEARIIGRVRARVSAL